MNSSYTSFCEAVRLYGVYEEFVVYKDKVYTKRFFPLISLVYAIFFGLLLASIFLISFYIGTISPRDLGIFDSLCFAVGNIVAFNSILWFVAIISDLPFNYFYSLNFISNRMGLKIFAIDPCNVTPYWLDFVSLNNGQISFYNCKVFDEKDFKKLSVEDISLIFKTLESKYTESVASDNKAILIDDFKHKQMARLETR